MCIYVYSGVGGETLFSGRGSPPKKVHIFAGAAVLLAFAGAASIALAVTGLCATTNESRSFHAVYFLFTLAVYSLVVIVTVATAINEPRIESILGTECEEHPWPNCSQDLPEIVTAVKANLKTVFYGALTVTGSLAALMTMTVFSAGEAKRAEYYEIKTVHPQFIVG